MEYHKIDETFKHDGHEYRVIDPCSLCAFHDKCGTSAGKYCDRDSREDGVDVIYKKAKGTKSIMYQCLRYLLFMIYSLCFIFYLTFVLLLSFSNINEFIAVAISCVITYMTNRVLMDFED